MEIIKSQMEDIIEIEVFNLIMPKKMSVCDRDTVPRFRNNDPPNEWNIVDCLLARLVQQLIEIAVKQLALFPYAMP